MAARQRRWRTAAEAIHDVQRGSVDELRPNSRGVYHAPWSGRHVFIGDAARGDPLVHVERGGDIGKVVRPLDRRGPHRECSVEDRLADDAPERPRRTPGHRGPRHGRTLRGLHGERRHWSRMANFPRGDRVHKFCLHRHGSGIKVTASIRNIKSYVPHKII